MPEFSDTEAAITESDLAAFEASYGLTLPDDYRRHIVEFNGGLSSHSYFLTDDEEYYVASFLPINNGEMTANIMLDTVRSLGEDRFPTDLYPFADDPFGNLFSIRQADGVVVLWIHDTDDEMEELAGSFSDFLENLSEDGEQYEF